MKVIQCEEGHFYDSEKYEECPVCKKLASKIKTELVKTEVPKSINNLDLSSLKECEEATQIISSNCSQDELYSMNSISQVDISNTANNGMAVGRPDDDGETQVSFWGNEEVGEALPKVEISAPQEDALTQVLGGFFDGEKAVEQRVKNHYNGPVVGWLVAISGPHKGQSFELYAKKNFIGRSDDNSVCLSMDKTVSRTSPLCVIFDSHKCNFIAMAGNSDQTAYINNQLVLQPVGLKIRDCIVLGASSLLFIPLVTVENNFENTYMIGK